MIVWVNVYACSRIGSVRRLSQCCVRANIVRTMRLGPRRFCGIEIQGPEAVREIDSGHTPAHTGFYGLRGDYARSSSSVHNKIV